MSTTSAKTSTDLPRIPKLAVRNKFPENENVAQSRNENHQVGSRSPEGTSGRDVAQLSSSPPESSNVGGTFVPNGRQPEPFQSSSVQGVNDDTTEAKKTPIAKKKKSGGVLAYLTLKEPSTKAWEEFADAERERAKQRGGNVLPSTQKLPDFVPKVNSRWDGMPESAKRRSLESRGSDKSKPNDSLTYPNRQSQGHSVDSARNERFEDVTAPQRDSMASNVATSSDGHNSPIDPFSSQAPLAHPQLSPLPPVSPFPSALNLNRHDKASSSPENKVETSQVTPTDKTNDFSPPVAGIDDSQTSSPTKEYASDASASSPTSETQDDGVPPKIPERNPRRKPINFSRPRPMPGNVLLQHDSEPRTGGIENS